MARPNIALQLTSGGVVVARLRARRHPLGPLAAERGRWYDFRCQESPGRPGRGRGSLLGSHGSASWVCLEPPAEAEPVHTTVDHADIRGLGTTVLVSVAAPASL